MKMQRREFLRAGAAGVAIAGLAGCAGLPGGSPKARVVVIGGGYGGATASKYIRLFDPSIEMWRVFVSPGFSSGSDPHAYEGEELILCEEGCVTFAFEECEYQMQAGDSLHFKADLPHRWWNDGDTVARIIIAGTFPKALRRKLHEQMQNPRKPRR